MTTAQQCLESTLTRLLITGAPVGQLFCKLGFGLCPRARNLLHQPAKPSSCQPAQFSVIAGASSILAGDLEARHSEAIWAVTVGLPQAGGRRSRKEEEGRRKEAFSFSFEKQGHIWLAGEQILGGNTSWSSAGPAGSGLDERSGFYTWGHLMRPVSVHWT